MLIARQRQVLWMAAIATAMALSGGATEASAAAESEAPLEIPVVSTAPRLEDFLGDAPSVAALRIDRLSSS